MRTRMLFPLALTLAFSLLSLGCSRPPASPPAAPPAACDPCTESSSSPAEPAASIPEPLPIAILQYRDLEHAQVIMLHSDYGYLAHWVPEADPEFFIYDRPQHRITHTMDFDSFLVQLKLLPRGATLDTICGCGGGFSYDMPPDKVTQLNQAIRESGLVLNPLLICTCESTDITFFWIAN